MEQLGLKTSASLGCWHCRWLLNLLSHNARSWIQFNSPTMCKETCYGNMPLYWKRVFETLCAIYFIFSRNYPSNNDRGISCVAVQLIPEFQILSSYFYFRLFWLRRVLAFPTSSLLLTLFWKWEHPRHIHQSATINLSMLQWCLLGRKLQTKFLPVQY